MGSGARTGRSPSGPGRRSRSTPIGSRFRTETSRSAGPAATSPDAFVGGLARARIGSTFNFYRHGRRAPLLRERLVAYLDSRAGASTILVGEAPGYRGARVSGLPFTSERQLSGSGPAEATATIVQGVLRELGIEQDVLLWNVVPTHPGTETGNRRPTRAEVAAGLPFLEALAAGRRVVPVGRVAQAAVGGEYLRHPSHGGAEAFRRGLSRLLLPCGLGGHLVRPFSV